MIPSGFQERIVSSSTLTFEINLGGGVDIVVLSNFFFGIHIFFDIGKGHY